MLHGIRITQPTLIVDEARVRANIGRMAEKAARSGVRFRPHFKTHQSAFIGTLYRQSGVRAICVSSVDMAEYFADAGWDDILLLAPANRLQIERVNVLAARLKLSLHIESVDTARFLAANLTASVDVWIEIDSGKRRTGIWHDDENNLHETAHTVRQSQQMRLRGILTFAGQSYGAKTRTEIVRIYDETAAIMNRIRDGLAKAGIGGLDISVGDTPTCSIKETLDGVDEIRPGTLVFYDVMQMQIGACSEADIAVAVGCPVISIYPERREIAIYGGAVHLARDWLRRPDGTTIFGLVTTFHANGWEPTDPDCYVADVSQEISIARVSETFLERISVGDVVAVLPVHVCLTVNEFRRFTTLTGQMHLCMAR